MSGAGGILECVVDQVRNHPLDRRHIHLDQGQVGWHADVDVASFQQTSNTIQSAVHQGNGRNRLAVHMARALAANTGVVEQVVDQFGEAIGLVLDLSQKITPSLVVPLDISPAQRAHEALDVAEG